MPVCFSVSNSRQEYLRTKIGYSNKEKEKNEKNKVMLPHKPVTSLDECRLTFNWITLYLL